jgi:hypothetical protein
MDCTEEKAYGITVCPIARGLICWDTFLLGEKSMEVRVSGSNEEAVPPPDYRVSVW